MSIPTRTGLLLTLLVATATSSFGLPLQNVTAPGSWELLPGFSATIALGVSFSTPESGMIVGGQDGIGAQIWGTEDGGRSTTPAQIESGDLPPLLLLHGAKIRDVAVASGVFAAWSSIDGGRSYRPATGPGSIGPAQSVDAFIQDDEIKIAIVGETIAHNGIAVSTDGGATFGPGVEVFEDKTIQANIGARYGAFPSADAWYVSGGRFPSNDDGNNDVHYMSESIYIKKSAVATNESTFGFRAPQKHRRALQDDPYTAGIAKSTDMGATWETIYETETAGYYFNQISCFTAERCVVVAEGGGTARIYTTSDGGREWRQTLQPTTGSLMAVEALTSSGEGWAAGGILGFQFTALFWHTTDFGENWTLREYPGFYAFDIGFPAGRNDVGYAAVLTPSTSRLARYELA